MLFQLQLIQAAHRHPLTSDGVILRELRGAGGVTNDVAAAGEEYRNLAVGVHLLDSIPIPVVDESPSLRSVDDGSVTVFGINACVQVTPPSTRWVMFPLGS